MRPASSTTRCNLHQLLRLLLMTVPVSILRLKLLVLDLLLLGWRRLLRLLLYKLWFIAIPVRVRSLRLTRLAELLMWLAELFIWRSSIRLYRVCLGHISNIGVDMRILIRDRLRILARDWVRGIRGGSSAVMRRCIRTRRSVCVWNLLLARKTRILRHGKRGRGRRGEICIRRGRGEASRHSRRHSSLRGRVRCWWHKARALTLGNWSPIRRLGIWMSRLARRTGLRGVEIRGLCILILIRACIARVATVGVAICQPVIRIIVRIIQPTIPARRGRRPALMGPAGILARVSP